MPAYLRMYVLYWNPSDYPLKWVLRRFLIKQEGPVADHEPWAVANTKDEALHHLPTHELYRLPRDPDDQAQIIEIWL